MPKETETKSKFFNFVIDEDRAEIMQMMLTVWSREWTKFAEQETETAIRLQVPMQELVAEWSEKVHEIGWCKDPDCKS